MKKSLKLLSVFVLVLLSLGAHSAPIVSSPSQSGAPLEENQKTSWRKVFPITFYKTTYVLPFYYTASPYYALYQGNTPDNQELNKTEIKFQISFKVPIVTNLFYRGIGLYIAYSQLSYWQAYVYSAFFRETNYEPEFFFEFPVDRTFWKNWEVPSFTIGAVHQSNGRGGEMERSWNRFYAEFFVRRGNFVASFKPWWIVPTSTNKYNRDISNYLGHGRALLGYRFHHQFFSLELRNNLESGFSKGSQMISWSIPLTKQLKFYLQYFNGYGQSLIEYDHKTQAVGAGISLNDELEAYLPNDFSNG